MTSTLTQRTHNFTPYKQVSLKKNKDCRIRFNFQAIKNLKGGHCVFKALH